jgi:DNA-binding transcriptional MerR regulator
MNSAGWTIDELASRVAAALADGYPGAPNGRVRDVPDQRAIRWYATRGLVDRPAAMRGRTALYGQRHLLQLVAVKRLQAGGHSLAEIQARLAGATEETLRAIADVPDLLDPPVQAAAPPTARPRFWAAPAPVQVASVVPRTDADRRDGDAGGRAAEAVGVLAAVPLRGGAVLLLPAPPGALDVPAIRAAAQPLLDLLAARGLIVSPHPSVPADGNRSELDAFEA